MRVIGTAGHVDHGKSTLIAALTGIHPDRLKEEQEREMTIELGFAWLDLPNGEEVGIVDVPGHRDFIGNMLAGVGGIDTVLLVIAADEGVMPQTREHLAILDLLHIQNGIVVLSKIDLIHDPDWLDLIEEDILTTLSTTILADAPIVRVSARTKTGFPELINLLSSILTESSARPDLGRPRLPIDRVFSIAGFGTVVTGTLLDGSFSPGEEVEILPSQHTGRIRGLQNHKKKEGIAAAGSRTAINISGLNVEEIQRGEVVVRRNQYIPTRRLDINFRLLSDVKSPIKHGMEVKLFIGTAEIIAKVRLLGKDFLEPGDSGWLQLELRSPVVAVRGDRFILRRPSPSETLGGGSIVDPHPKYRHKRFSNEVIENLENLLIGSPAEILLQACLVTGPSQLKDVIKRSGLDEELADSAFDELIEDGLLICFESENQQSPKEQLVISNQFWKSITSQLDNILIDYHRKYPLKPGIPREELKSRLKLTSPIYNSILSKITASQQLVDKGSLIYKSDFKITFSPSQQISKMKLLERFEQSPYSPPTIKECITEVGEDVFNAMVVMSELKQVSSEVVFRSQDFDSLVNQTRQFIEKNGEITVAEARDIYNTSRRYVLALLEFMDSTGITTRDGDVRRLRR
jgi:selenocysteine-specific elongation factor